MGKPHNNSKVISASEINRFLYCNHQWYYERYYGNQFIRNLYKERFPDRGSAQPKIFERGKAFHDSYLRVQRFRVLKKILLIMLIAALLILGYFAKDWLKTFFNICGN